MFGCQRLPRLAMVALALTVFAWFASTVGRAAEAGSAPATPKPAPAAAPARAPAAPKPNRARLGRNVVPISEAIRLWVDPAQESYRGSVKIEIRVALPCDTFQLHARGLKIEHLGLASEGKPLPATFTRAPLERLTVRPGSTLAPGDYLLTIDYSTDFDVKASSLYHVRQGDDWYAFTDFETANARQAFPCWDEPEFKIPWQVTLRVPAQDTVLSNTPVERIETQGDYKTVMFEHTPPLPSYLVAFMVGPFDVVPVYGTSIPTRIVAVKGQGGLTGEAVREVPHILAALERYFGRPYPYKKLDFIAVPEYLWGAMENPGAITFLDNWLLLDPKATTNEQRRTLSGTIAHELAHMWFGDLVTMKWWDDLWLNESFASWMGDKITDEVYPELNIPMDQLRGRQRAFNLDDHISTHAMRQRVDENVNLEQLADQLAYSKGEAVLGMFEQWIGPEVFRTGVLAYIEAHAWGNAEGADLWNELSKASGRDVAGAMTTFLDQPGVPLVSASLLPGGQVRLRQQRYAIAGESVPPGARWRIPVVLRYSDGRSVHTDRVLLSDTAATVKLATGAIPAWLHPNADEIGYYHWRLDPEALSALSGAAESRLSARERAGYVSNLHALLLADQLHGDDYLNGIAAFASDTSADVLTAVLAGVDEVRLTFVTDRLEEPFARYLQSTLRPALERLGTTPRPGESVDVSNVRARLIETLGREGRDAALQTWGLVTAKEFLSDAGSADPTLVDAALALSAMSNDSTLYHEYRHRFETAQLPEDRVHFLRALGRFTDPALVDRNFDYALNGPLRPQEMYYLFVGLETEALRDRSWAWAQRNYVRLADKLPEIYRSAIVRFAEGCSREKLEAAREFFGEPEHSPLGTDREMARLSSGVMSCVSLRDREGANVARVLEAARAK